MELAGNYSISDYCGPHYITGHLAPAAYYSSYQTHTSGAKEIAHSIDIGRTPCKLHKLQYSITCNSRSLTYDHSSHSVPQIGSMSYFADLQLDGPIREAVHVVTLHEIFLAGSYSSSMHSQIAPKFLTHHHGLHT